MVIEKGAVRDEQKIKDIYSIATTGKARKDSRYDPEEKKDTSAEKEDTSAFDEHHQNY